MNCPVCRKEVKTTGRKAKGYSRVANTFFPSMMDIPWEESHHLIHSHCKAAVNVTHRLLESTR
jgi:hypothetical protein